MLTRRTLTLVILLIVPLVVYLGLGAYALWQTGLFLQTFWILPAFWILTWFVSMLWVQDKPLHVLESPLPPRHFTRRDEEALQIVRRYQQRVDELNPDQLTDYQFYADLSQELAQELARHYHPRSTDPVSNLTVLEVLAAARLALDDLESWMLDSMPGSQLVTIRQWRWLRHAPKWVRRIQNTAWAAGMLINPANVLKYFTSQMTVGPIAEEVQTELLAAIYLRFVRQVGFYLIEMNSGRLRGGADRYRQTFGQGLDAYGQTRSLPPQLAPESLTVVLVGQVKAGKSSLVNALIGQKVASSDVLPETRHVARYRVQVPETEVQLTLLDTPGYADAGATREQMQEVQQALHDADVVLLVLDAHSPAKAADRKVMDDLKRWYDGQHALKPSPVVICLTHIDLLSPALEWNPPYQWQAPQSRKEHSIHDAVEYVRSQFSDVTRSVVPVCSDVERGRSSRVIEDLFPALLSVLSEGQMASLIRTYHEQLDRERWNSVLRQLRNSGKNLLRVWVEERLGGDSQPDGPP
ncbi:GTPase [Planctomicrobium sp. SH664]|uniref:GTPase n=1 Tax=Planctomicrobium sp. SH664 TaxID=3448125 RepID=UPI003F5B7482